MCVIKDVKFPPFSEHKDSYPYTLTVTIDYLCSHFFHPVLLLFLLHTPHYRPIMRRTQLWSCPLLCLSSWTSMPNLSWVNTESIQLTLRAFKKRRNWSNISSNWVKSNSSLPLTVNFCVPLLEESWQNDTRLTIKITLWGSNTLKYTKNDGTMLIFLQVADSYYNETIILKKKWATFKQCFFSSSSIYTIIIYTIPPLRVRLPGIIPSTPFNNNFLCVSVKHLQLPSSDSFIYIYPPKKLTPPKKT